MKILDTSVAVAIFNDIRRPDLIDRILEQGHELAVPYHVLGEIYDKNTSEGVRKCIEQGKIRTMEENTAEEIREFNAEFPNLGLGECDVILSYEKLDGADNVYCILDDREARTAASERGVRFAGLIRLLMLLRDRKIMTREEIGDVVALLRKSRFRFPRDVEI